MLVLILVATATVLGVTYATSTTVKLVSTANLVKAGRARYLAESGVNHALYVLRTDPAFLIGSESTLIGPYSADSSVDTYYLGSAEVAGQTGQYVLTGRARAGGVAQTVTMQVYVESKHAEMMNALNPAHHWRFGELSSNNIAADGKGDWTGEYKGTVGREWPGAIVHDTDTAARFDGHDDRVELNGGAAGGEPDLSGQAITILAWINPTRHNHLINHNARIISKADGVFEQDHYWMVSTVRADVDTRLRFSLKTHVDRVEAEEEHNGTTTTLTATAGSVPLNKWTLAAVTYNGAQMRIYQDGKQVGNMAKIGFITKDKGKKAWIGGNPPGKEDRPWYGKIDEVAVFDRVLIEDEIKALYDARLPEVRKLAWDE